jgi:large subunit ribosomal protein L35
MPKKTPRNKTRKAAAKRFKITGTGKLVRSKAGRRHLAACKNRKTKRNLGKSTVIHASDSARVKECLPFG